MKTKNDILKTTAYAVLSVAELEKLLELARVQAGVGVGGHSTVVVHFAEAQIEPTDDGERQLTPFVVTDYIDGELHASRLSSVVCWSKYREEGVA